MKSFLPKETCPNCHFPKMKRWDELTDEQKFLAERLPMSAEYPLDQRKKHRFCERCWFEDNWSESKTV